jgi:uncharacterized membrane protein YsdA (DUF1294 family)/cold shock CspA family protein
MGNHRLARKRFTIIRVLFYGPLRGVIGMQIEGIISYWDDKKGYGFITPNAGGPRVFVHAKAVRHSGHRPEINQAVTYSMSADKQGRPCAVNVTGNGGNCLKREPNKKAGILAIFGVLDFFLVVGVAVALKKIPSFVLAIYFVASLITFIVYAFDKSAAKKGAWRTSEMTLHLLSVVGGWPGALIGQQLLRHKSKKQLFRAIFWTTVLINGAAFVWILTPEGAATLQSLTSNIKWR